MLCLLFWSVLSFTQHCVDILLFYVIGLFTGLIQPFCIQFYWGKLVSCLYLKIILETFCMYISTHEIVVTIKTMNKLLHSPTHFKKSFLLFLCCLPSLFIFWDKLLMWPKTWNGFVSSASLVFRLQAYTYYLPSPYYVRLNFPPLHRYIWFCICIIFLST